MKTRWLLHCSLGEAAGIALVAVAYAAADRGLAPLVPAVLAAGAWEGLCLGLAQAMVLRRAGVGATHWVLATVFAATLGYGLSLVGGAGAGGAEGPGPPLALMLAAAAGLGAAMGVMMGAIQWTAARLFLHPRRWIWRNAAGWALAMPAIFAGSASVSADWSLPAIALTGAVSGAVAGAALGLLTGPALPRPPGAA
ncbi:MAG: hypothetical protein OEM24_04295 [Paracoccaceae bacterium]|nr:hypothetical protein [Paracoccaceae bacterium]